MLDGASPRSFTGNRFTVQVHLLGHRQSPSLSDRFSDTPDNSNSASRAHETHSMQLLDDGLPAGPSALTPSNCQLGQRLGRERECSLYDTTPTFPSSGLSRNEPLNRERNRVLHNQAQLPRCARIIVTGTHTPCDDPAQMLSRHTDRDETPKATQAPRAAMRPHSRVRIRLDTSPALWCLPSALITCHLMPSHNVSREAKGGPRFIV